MNKAPHLAIMVLAEGKLKLVTWQWDDFERHTDERVMKHRSIWNFELFQMDELLTICDNLTVAVFGNNVAIVTRNHIREAEHLK